MWPDEVPPYPRRNLNDGLVELHYAENTVSLAELNDLVEELGREFIDVRVSRLWAGPMADPLFGNSAIALILGVPAAALLGEISRDVYRKIKDGLYSAYKKARHRSNGRSYRAFEIRIAQIGLPRMEVRTPTGL